MMKRVKNKRLKNSSLKKVRFKSTLVTSNVVARLLKRFTKESGSDKLTIDEILSSAGNMGFAFTMLVLSSIAIIPIPLPISFILGPPLVFLSLQIAKGKKCMILPKRIGKISIDRKRMSMLMRRLYPFLAKLEKISKRRMLFMLNEKIMSLIGMFSLVMALAISLPLPLTGMLPGISITIISIGIMSKDGLIIIVGIISGLIGLLLALKIMTIIIIRIFL